MGLRLTAAESEKLARDFAVSPRALQRSISIVNVQHGDRIFRIGLGLDATTVGLGITREQLLADILRVLREYRRCCPKIVAWLQRGDFDPTKVSPGLSEGELLHSNRVASRLRAQLLRKSSNPNQ